MKKHVRRRPETGKAKGEKTVSGALRIWRLGGFGTLGFQYFYAGKRHTAAVQCLVGCFLWGMLLLCFLEDGRLVEKLAAAGFILAVLAFLSYTNYKKIIDGKLLDESGVHIIKE